MHRNTTCLIDAHSIPLQNLQHDCESLLLANSLPLNPIQISWHSTNLDGYLEEATQANFNRELEILLAMELDGLITKSQIAQILFETSKLGR